MKLRQQVFGDTARETLEARVEVAAAMEGAEAEPFSRETLGLLKTVPGTELLQAQANDAVASALLEQARFVEAEAVFREALVVRRAHLASDSFEVGRSLSNVGNSLGQQRRFAEASAANREAIAIMEAQRR